MPYRDTFEVEAPPPSRALVSDDGAHIALVFGRQTVPESHAQGGSVVRLGEMVFDPRNGASRCLVDGFVPMVFDGVTVRRTSDGAEVFTVRNADEIVWPVGFSSCGGYFALLRIAPLNVTMSWIDLAVGCLRSCTSAAASAAAIGLGAPVACWLGDRLVFAVAEPAADDSTSRPLLRSSDAVPARPIAVLAEALQGDEASIARQFTTALVIVDPCAPERVVRVGEPDCFVRVSGSSDGRYLLTHTLAWPPRLPSRMSRLMLNAHIRDARTGRIVASLGEVRGRDADGLTPRWEWHPFTPTAVRVASTADAAAMTLLDEPFDGAPRHQRVADEPLRRPCWLDASRLVALTADGARIVVFDTRDQGATAVAMPASPREARGELDMVTGILTNDRGTRAVSRDGAIFLHGVTGSGSYAYPFLDGVRLQPPVRWRHYQNADPSACDEVVAFVGGASADTLLTRIERSDAPAVHRLVRPADGVVVPLERRAAHVTALAGSRTRPLTCLRADGVELTPTVYLPPPAAGGERPPIVFWIHPVFVASAAEVTATPSNRFRRADVQSPLLLLPHGCAVVTGAVVPIVGSPTSRLDTLVSQLSMSATAMADAVVAAGIGTPDQFVAAGHCLGAWATALLLAHTATFRAGIARSGIFNLAAQPFAFTGSLSPGGAPALFAALSPVFQPSAISAPLLIMHGECEGPPVESAVESRRMYDAMVRNGRPARYVVLEGVGHWCSSRASARVMVGEMAQWCRRHAGAGVDAGAIESDVEGRGATPTPFDAEEVHGWQQGVRMDAIAASGER